MITIGLIKHLSTGRILITALASVGIKTILKSVSIFLNQNYESSTSIICIHLLFILQLRCCSSHSLQCLAFLSGFSFVFQLFFLHAKPRLKQSFVTWTCSKFCILPIVFQFFSLPAFLFFITSELVQSLYQVESLLDLY